MSDYPMLISNKLHSFRNFTLQTLRKKCFITHEGVSMLGISEAAESIGFRSLGVRLDTDKLVENASLPSILQHN